MREQEIRPKELFEKYLELSFQDSLRFNHAEFIEVSCPGCGTDNENKIKFSKNGFKYVLCQNCGSLYCNPRPPQATLDQFYTNSKSAQYWSTIFLPAVAEARREKIFRKRAQQIHATLAAKNIKPERICDIGAGYGIFLEELRKYFPASSFYAIEPGEDAARICREKGFQTLQCPAEQSHEWFGEFDFVVCSEVIEHVFSTSTFIQALYDLLDRNGSCLVTGLGYEGFDILTLQEESSSISPPHHMNFMSIGGFKTLFMDQSFSNVEVITPGELDLDIVHNKLPDNEFVRVLFTRGEKAVEDFQALLQKHRLSSHVWVWAKK